AANTGAKRVAVNKYTLSDEYALGVYPNPAREFFDIRVVLPGEAHVSLRLFDLAGRQVASLANALYGEGEHLLSTGTGHGLAPGIYLLQMKATPVEEAGHSFTREMKVVIM
ncbi:MAG: T9SS type A sorting domain-containing protein, partial [Actinomycetota bacterium]|nr:T9SS type A sorting domain-containing protein [Actinomycetota bacterium]